MRFQKNSKPGWAESTEKLSPQTLAPAAPVVGGWEDFPLRFLQLAVLVRLSKSEMLPFGRFEILEARTTVVFFFFFRVIKKSFTQDECFFF